jgi:hypothetical protein
LPLLAQDTGPNNSPEFHVRARGLRLGANFEWLDPAPKTTITGKIEFDFEGDFPRVNNRNITSIRSSQPSLRLAWVRIDRRFSDNNSAFVLFGQDLVSFVSSTFAQQDREHKLRRRRLRRCLHALSRRPSLVSFTNSAARAIYSLSRRSRSFCRLSEICRAMSPTSSVR